jgi:hypothetical protein
MHDSHARSTRQYCYTRLVSDAGILDPRALVSDRLL